MSQIEVTKLTQFNVIGPPADHIAVPKLTMYVLLTPGDGGGEAPARQAHVYSQKIRRD
jgi:hypothetical protein